MKRSYVLGGVVVIAIAVIVLSVSPSPATAAGKGKVAKTQPAAVNPETLTKSASHLLDRDSGAVNTEGAGRDPRNTLNPLLATPYAGIDSSLWYGPGTDLAGGFMGNCFDNDYIPIGWYPDFRIIGAWAVQAQTTPVAIPPTNYNIAAGAWPIKLPGAGTFSTGWASFQTYQAPFSLGLVGGVSLWGNSVSGGIPVTYNQEICGGLLVLRGWANLIGLVSGGGGSLYATFIGQPVFGNSVVRPDSTWLAGYGYDVMAGLYVSGATVPVELQSLHLE